MGARTVESGYFGSLGMGDPMSSFAERTLRVAWDFSKKNVPENKTIPLMQIPKGFCIDRISLVQTKATDQDFAVTFGLASDDSYIVGGSFALKDLSGESALCRASYPAKVGGTTKTSAAVYVAASSGGSPTTSVTPVTGVTAEGALFVDDADVLCMIVPNGLTNDKCAKGAFDLCVHGFEVFSEGVAGNKLDIECYRTPLQTQQNVSGGEFPLD